MTLPPDDARVIAVVPLRDGVSGKSRLATALDPPARQRLIAALARHVVGVLTTTAGIDRVVVVTEDVPFATGLLPGDRVEVIPQVAERPGLNGALDVGREHAAALGAATVLVAHADLPRLSTDDVAAVLVTEPGSVVVATDRHDAGTNLLRVPVGSSFRFRFGPGSRAAHVAEAGRAVHRAVVVRRPGTSTDLDTIDDWGELPPDTRAWLDGVVGTALP